MKRSITGDIEDILSRDANLTDDQAMQVLEYIEENHDANHGITWDTIDSAIEFILQ